MKKTNEIDARTQLTSTNNLEMLIFSLEEKTGDREPTLYGINVFKVREIVGTPNLTKIAGAKKEQIGVAQLRSDVIPVFDLPRILEHEPKDDYPLIIVTEYSRSTQAFAIAEVKDIARISWEDVVSTESTGVDNDMVTSVAYLGEKGSKDRKLVQVLDVEAILEKASPSKKDVSQAAKQENKLRVPANSLIIAADDSALARKMLENALTSFKLPYEMYATGQQAWDRIQKVLEECIENKQAITERLSLIITDLEMPEMDGFTLTRNIKADHRLQPVPVLVHSSLSGSTNADLVNKAGADGYVVKFSVHDLHEAIQMAIGEQ